MRTSAKLGAYALGLAAVFTAALGAGHLAGPTPAVLTSHDEVHVGDSSGAGEHGAGGHLPAGLQVSQDGYRLVPVSTTLALGTPKEFRFRVLGLDGAPVTRYVTSHDKDLHLIVVRRDLSGFQHLHPTLAADGTWSVPIAVGAAGQYRVFADFQPDGHADGLTLGVDVPAPGDYQPASLPSPARTASVDGYTVTLDGDLTPGTSSRLTLSVSEAGQPVTDLQPYLGAYGHLVALREGDLAYLHVHPDGTPGDGHTAAGPQITFHTEVPSAGTYRLFLDFRHGGKVRTVAFTASAGHPDPTATTSSAATPAPTTSAGHGAPGHSHG
ncbi:hypothetical protein [Micromonospora sp. KC213]|uniref:hypothetical protein n=1 Tax=Micromonospora sp. KC213 TaxID=2530378 RepID=UPI00104CF0BA|nr:hypothetical protein [Micromonospora sp. KC213]TDC43004.1 hypothetical protein E1166_05510 [Micromonospora sp. KC213]